MNYVPSRFNDHNIMKVDLKQYNVYNAYMLIFNECYYIV